MSAVENVQAFCGRELEGRYELEIVDLYANPDRAQPANVIVAPTLIRHEPSQLGSCRTGADDGDLQLLGPQRLGLRVRAYAGVDEASDGSVRILGRLEAMAFDFTPGVPKSLVRLPTAMTSVS